MEPGIAEKGGGDVDLLTPTMGAVGEIGRTPIPVAESTCHPGERPSTPVTKHEGERPGRKGESPTPAQSKGGTTREARGDHRGGEPEWALPKPSDPHRPLRGGTGKEEVPLRDTLGWGEGPTEQEYPIPDQQLIEAHKKRRRRLAALARDHIMRLREERERMAYDWLEEYARCASSARQSGTELNTLRAEYIHRYNQLLDWEKQPHSDFFTNLSLDFEEELDFNENEPADLSEYDQYFEWDEAEYMRLRFTAPRHYASHGHWDDAYAYVLRTRPDDIPQHKDTYNRNAQVWHCTNARINELIQEAEQTLEAQDRQLSQQLQFRPPRDSLIPPGHSTGTPSPIRSVQGKEQGPRGPFETIPTRRVRGQGGRTTLKSPHSLNKESQKEERDSVIEPQGGLSPRGRHRTPPEPQRQFKQLKIYNKTPTGRPLPTLQQIRQANLWKIFEEEGVDTNCDICGDPHHDYRNCTKEAYRESQDVRQSPVSEKGSEGQCPNCDIPHPGVCPFAWCEQPGHTAQDCMAHFADDSM